jgi:hypothetical protein
MKKHFLYTPFTGLGLYNGYRGDHWLKNRIKVFKQFVVPSLLNQTNRDFVLWVSWRPQERTNPQVIELKEWLDKKLENVFTYSGVCFWDDKYPDDVARDRLLMAIHGAAPELTGVMNKVWGDEWYNYEAYMTIQPSDDCYHKNAVRDIQNIMRRKDVEACGFKHGYIINYATKDVAQYNPTTNPPFYTIKFLAKDFIDPLKHTQHTGPYKSHEYVPDFLKYEILPGKMYLVGTHNNNISTTYNIPYKGCEVSQLVLTDFGIYDVPPAELEISPYKKWFDALPHPVRRKLRYWFGEKLMAKLY